MSAEDRQTSSPAVKVIINNTIINIKICDQWLCDQWLSEAVLCLQVASEAAEEEEEEEESHVSEGQLVPVSSQSYSSDSEISEDIVQGEDVLIIRSMCYYSP